MKLNALDLNKIPIFLVVMRLGTLSLASEELHLTKSAISQALAVLESQLGKPLFLRVKNRLVPTQEGIALHKKLLNFESYVLQAVESFCEEEEGLAGELIIGCYFEFAKGHLLSCVEQFLRQHPRARIRFRFESPSRLETLLIEGKIDFSLSIYPHRGIKSTRSRKLVKTELVLMAHKNILNRKIGREDLVQVPIVDYYSDHQLILRWFRSQFGRIRFDPKIRVYAASAEMVAELIAQQVGIGVVPYYVAEPFLKKDCHIVNAESPPLFDHIWINERTKAGGNPLRTEFLKLLSEQFLRN